jgi:hypothetical protein
VEEITGAGTDASTGKRRLETIYAEVAEFAEKAFFISHDLGIPGG